MVRFLANVAHCVEHLRFKTGAVAPAMHTNEARNSRGGAVGRKIQEGMEKTAETGQMSEKTHMTKGL